MAGFWRRISGFFRVPSVQFDSAPRPIDLVIAEMLGAGGNPRVSRAEALSVPAVQRGRNLICSISTLPLIQLNRRQERVRNPLLEQLDPDVPNVVTLAQTLEDLFFEGIAWWLITAQDFAGFPVAVRHLDVSSVTLAPPAGAVRRSPNPLPSGDDPRGATVWIDGVETPASRVIRFDSPNPAVLKVAGRAIRRAVALDTAAAMYADDPRPLDYFTPADGADPIDDTEVLSILADWKSARKKRSTAWVPQSMKYNSVTQPSPRELQLAELDKAAGLQLANALGVDPEELGISTTSRTYSNVIDRRQDRINDVLSPYMLALTQRLSMGDVTRQGHQVLLDLDDYLRANPTERWSTYEVAHRIGAITVDEIRTEERMPPLPGEVDPPPEPAPTGDPAPGDDQDPAEDSDPATVGATAGGLALRFDGGGGDDPFHFDIPVRQFSVNKQRRTIEGMALPYGAIAYKYGLKFRFMRGALKWSAVERVKMLRDHDMRQPLGVATRLENTTTGLNVRFKVARGPEGDRALELAEDRVLDGLSVGLDFDLSADTEVDPNDDSVMLVRRADLREVSLTAMPAFDDARVTKVAASRGGNTMPEPDSGAPATAVTDPPNDGQQPAQPAGLALSNDQLQALLSRPGAIQALVAAQQPAQPQQPATPPGALTLSAEQVDGLIRSGGLATLLGVPQLTPAPTAEPPRQIVDPTRNQARVTASVREPLPYTFDREGNLTRGVTYDFSTDIINGAKGDGEAMQRAQQFIKAMGHMFTGAQFDVDTTDVAALNPNRNRPDMYVPQRDFTYPVWDAISKGTLNDQVPFVLPKFNSASGLVTTHTQGTEPTPGAFTATSQTITPTANSGKVEITREAWDSGGNPQLSGIIWGQMVKAWFEALEAAAVAHLDSLSPTGITLTTGAEDAVLVGELEAALASLQYVRGGFRMRDFFIQIDLYKKLVDATDADGRKLLPRLGPSNAAGQVSDMYADLDIGGLRGRPAWALAASGTVAASSYLFDRSDVHGWASAPQRLQFEYRVAYVDVAIWGYKATATTDVTGVREVIYDPAV
jgi:HK97 family phage prohead protease